AAIKQNWLGFALWPLLLATSAMAVVDNGHVVLIEVGIMESFSCTPFPFYSSYLPLHEYLPGLFMSGGICGQNAYAIFGIPFTIWTLLSVTGLFLFTLFSLWRSIRPARS
ncbi:MAG: disulfide bond formation protein B, partial [Pseudomonas sp.]